MADHLWQSLLCVALACGLAQLTRRRTAFFGLWLWRVTLLKFLLPFSLLVQLGGWAGFPVAHSADSPPRWLVDACRIITPWVAPVSRPTLAHAASLALLLLLAVLSVLAARTSWRRSRVQAERWRLEQAARDSAAQDAPGNLSFWQSALVSTCVASLISAPVAAGAVEDQLSRLELLVVHERHFRDARVSVVPAAPGQGQRYRVSVDRDGVSIRNATLREVMGLAFGVSRFAVHGLHFRNPDEPDWLIDDRHDLRIDGLVADPERFDTYALRQPLTRTLAEKFGIEVYLNGKCQPPCGRWGSFVLPPEAREAAAAQH